MHLHWAAMLSQVTVAQWQTAHQRSAPATREATLQCQFVQAGRCVYAVISRPDAQMINQPHHFAPASVCRALMGVVLQNEHEYKLWMQGGCFSVTGACQNFFYHLSHQLKERFT